MFSALPCVRISEPELFCEAEMPVSDVPLLMLAISEVRLEPVAWTPVPMVLPLPLAASVRLMPPAPAVNLPALKTLLAEAVTPLAPSSELTCAARPVALSSELVGVTEPRELPPTVMSKAKVLPEADPAENLVPVLVAVTPATAAVWNAPRDEAEVLPMLRLTV